MAETQRQLDEAKAKLREVEEGIATLQAKYEDCVAKKEELEHKCALCEARLERADKLIGGLADEKGRWQESVDRLESVIKSIVGDVLVSAGYVAYLGPFTVSVVQQIYFLSSLTVIKVALNTGVEFTKH